MRRNFIIGGILVAIIMVIVGSVYFLSPKKIPKSEEVKKEEVFEKHTECLGENEQADFKVERLGKYPSVEYDKGFIEIMVKKLTSDKKITGFKIDNIINPSHYHPAEIHKCGIYVIREFNYSPKTRRSTLNYSNDLWKYNYKNEGMEILKFSFTDSSGKYNSFYNDDFRIDSTENYVVLERGYLGKDDYSLVVKNLETKEDIFVLSANEIQKRNPNLAGGFDMREWSKDGRYFWGDIFDGAYVNAYFRIDTQNWKPDIYEALDGTGGGDALNVETGYVTYHKDIIPWTGDAEFDEINKEKWLKEGKKVHFYIYNLFTKKQIFLEIFDDPTWFTKPKWLSDTELQYELPSGEKKIYKLNEK